MSSVDAFERPLLAEPSRSSHHSMLPRRKNHGLSRQAAAAPKRTYEWITEGGQPGLMAKS